MPTILREQILTKDDLHIYLQDQQGVYQNPFRITYTIYRVISDKFYNQLCAEEPLLETINSIPLPFGIGKYFVAWQMPNNISIGKYRIKWNFQQYSDSPIQEEVQEFEIIQPGMTKTDTLSTFNQASFPHTTYVGGCPEGV